jgi:hypothetical protein
VWRGRRRGRRATACAAVAFICVAATAGCADAQDPEHRVRDADTIEPGLRSVVDVAVADLAIRLQVDPNRISVVDADAVVWPDAGVGCPQAGMQYPQVPVDGARIRLEVDGATYDYHAGGDRPEPFLCEPDRSREPEGRLDPDLGDLEQDG